MSALEILGYLPCTPKSQSQGVSKILNGELLAYANGSAVIIVDIQSLKQINVLIGGHVNAAVTAFDWHPLHITPSSSTTTTTSSSNTSSTINPLICATGDSEGKVSVWDVSTGNRLATLNDAHATAFTNLTSTGTPQRSDAPRVPVKGLAWVTARNLLAVLLSPGYLLLWDCRTGSIIWRRDLGTTDYFENMLTSSTDRRRIVLSTASGAFATLRFDSPSSDRVKFQRFQAEIASGTLRCALPGVHDVLMLVLQRELIAFDLEYGQPISTTTLPPNLPAFNSLLGCYGHAIGGIDPQDPGIDCLYCSHVDGSVSVWLRKKDSLSYGLEYHTSLSGACTHISRGAKSRNTSDAAAAAAAAADDDDDGVGAADALQRIKQAFCMMGPLARMATGSSFPDGKGDTMFDGNDPAIFEHLSTALPSFSSFVAATWIHHERGVPMLAARNGNGRVSSGETVLFNMATAGIEGRTMSSGRDRLNIMDPRPGTIHRMFVTGADAVVASTEDAQNTTHTIEICPFSSPTHPRADYSVVLMAVATDGSLWQWKLPLLSYTTTTATTTTAAAAITSPHCSISLLGISSCLSHRVTAMSTYPYPVIIHSPTTSHPHSTNQRGITPTVHAQKKQEAVSVIAVGTVTGSLDMITVRQGREMPLYMEAAASVSVHPGAVKGVKWLGKSSRVVSYSSDRGGGGEVYANALFVTDFRSGGSIPFREDSVSDPAPLVGLRSSPCGSYLLLIFKGLPSEVWYIPDTMTYTAAAAVMNASKEVSFASGSGGIEDASGNTTKNVNTSGGGKPVRLRQVDLPFTSAEWICHEEHDQQDSASNAPLEWAARSPMHAPSTAGSPVNQSGVEQPAAPEGRLVFTLADGRMGILSVKGRKISDAKPRMPTWLPLATGEFSTSCASSYGQYIYLGGVNGELVQWDSATGRTLVVDSGCNRIHRLCIITSASSISPTRHGEVDKTAAPTGDGGSGNAPALTAGIKAYLAVLSSSGSFTVFSLDATGRFLSSQVSWTSGTARIGRVMEIGWVNVPQPYCNGSVLATVLEGGALALVETLPGTVPAHPHQEHLTKRGSLPVTMLARAPSTHSPLPLPRPWRRLMRALLHHGIPSELLLDPFPALSPSRQSATSVLDALEETETALIAALPSRYRSAFISYQQQRQQRAALLLQKNGNEALTGVPSGSFVADDAATVESGDGKGGQHGHRGDPSHHERHDVRAMSQSPESLDGRQLMDMLASSMRMPQSPTGGGFSSSKGMPPRPRQASLDIPHHTETAIDKLGLRPKPSQGLSKLAVRGADVKQTFKTIGESVKDIASAGKDQLTRKLSARTSSFSSLGESAGGSSGGLHREGSGSVLFDDTASSSGGGGVIESHHNGGRLLGTATTTTTQLATRTGSLSATMKGSAAATATAPHSTVVLDDGDGDEEDAPALVCESLFDPGSSILGMIHAWCVARGLPAALTADEMKEYDAALSMHSVALRSAVAARVCSGCWQEYCFWRRLPLTVQSMVSPQRQSIPSANNDGDDDGGDGGPSVGGSKSHNNEEQRHESIIATRTSILGGGGDTTNATQTLNPTLPATLDPGKQVVELWSPGLESLIAKERSLWHAALPRHSFESSEILQEKRVLELLSLGDLQGAVGFLLAAAPARSTRFYRDALCTLGMAFACGLAQTTMTNSSIADAAAASSASAAVVQHDDTARILFVQAAKVITANAAAVGDSLLGVPLLCSTGEYDGAVSILQDAGLWRYAAALAAGSLSAHARMIPMERWASHVAEAEGRPWSAAGLLVGCGMVSSAMELLIQHGLPDAAAVVYAAVKEGGVDVEIDEKLLVGLDL